MFSTMNTAFVAVTPVSVKSFNTSFSPITSKRLTPVHHSNRNIKPTTPVAKFHNLDLNLSFKKIRHLQQNIDVKSVWNTAQKALAIIAVTAALTMTSPDVSEAARSGGRVGGSQFRSAPRSSAPRPSPSYGGGGYGGGYGYGVGPGLFMNPFISPFGGFGFGGFGGLGGLGGLFALAAVASLVSDVARSRSNSESDEVSGSSSTRTGLVVLKVGLLSNARSLQDDLDRMAKAADTSTTSGIAYVLQSVVTTLLRHPDYWAYGASSVKSVSLTQAESEFNQLALEERLKLKEETLTNSAGNKYESQAANVSDVDMSQAPAEFVVVSLIVATEGSIVTGMPKAIDGIKDVERSLRTLSGVTKDSVQAVEIVWAPQSRRDTLTEREMLEDHPELKGL